MALSNIEIDKMKNKESRIHHSINYRVYSFDSTLEYTVYDRDCIIGVKSIEKSQRK